MDDLEERVRERAERLLSQEGASEDRIEEYLEKARELVAIEDNQKLATKPVTANLDDIEPVEAVENAGEFPTLTDQGEGEQVPRRRGARSR
jgi:hypothetical protein